MNPAITIMLSRSLGVTIKLGVRSWVDAYQIMRTVRVVVFLDCLGQMTTLRLLGSSRSLTWYGRGWKCRMSWANLT